MKKTLYSKFDKKEITALPQVSFPGRIISIISPGETEKAVNYLLSSDILGVDTETKPAFHRGEQHQVGLLQVSNRTTCFLFRLNLTGITPAIKRLLDDPSVKKVGLSWHDDLRGLQAKEPFAPGLFIDLQDMVPQMGIEDLSLQKLYANFFGRKISKRQRLSNWEAPILDERQKQYAAIDAWACIHLYEEIVRLEKTHDYELVVVPKPEPATPKARARATGKDKAEVHQSKKTARKPRGKSRKKVNSAAKTNKKTARKKAELSNQENKDTHV